MDQNEQKQKPTVWFWYVIYCFFMFCTNILFSIYMYFLSTSDKSWIADHADWSTGVLVQMEAMWFSLFCGTVAIAIGFIVAPFLPRKPFAWVWGIVAIGFGLLNCCLLPATIPLLIFWLKPETKDYFS